MSQTDNEKIGWWSKRIRSFFSLFDRGVYYLMVAVYQVFFNVASAQILQGDTLKVFFSRIQIILGVFVLFKLAISLINVIVNPDLLGSDKSGQGFSQIVVRVILALIMLVAIMPLNIPGEVKPGSYEANLNANGLLFGTLYEFQDRVLEGNVLAKLIIGSPNSTGADERSNMKDAGNQLASLVLKGFVRINLKEGATDEYDSANWMCPDAESEVKEYIRNNEVNEQDVASHFEIPIAKVRSWIKEGRIQYKNDPKENITSLYCRVCGKKIAFGVVCPECHSLENLKGVAANQVKKGELGAMRFLGK